MAVRHHSFQKPNSKAMHVSIKAIFKDLCNIPTILLLPQGNVCLAKRISGVLITQPRPSSE
jgi:hypothetical protein